jgi:hypothetical protein
MDALGGMQRATKRPGPEEAMANPQKWKFEHHTIVLLAMLAGAAAGIVVGFATSHAPWSLLAWLTERTSDAVAFAAVGAMVVGGAVSAWRGSS